MLFDQLGALLHTVAIKFPWTSCGLLHKPSNCNTISFIYDFNERTCAPSKASWAVKGISGQ